MLSNVPGYQSASYYMPGGTPKRETHPLAGRPYSLRTGGTTSYVHMTLVDLHHVQELLCDLYIHQIHHIHSSSHRPTEHTNYRSLVLALPVTVHTYK